MQERTHRPALGRLLLWVPTILLAALFLLEGLGKVLAVDMMVQNWQRWGYPMWLMFLVGGIETIGAIALLSRRTAFYASIALLALMPGAIYTHVQAEEWSLLPLPLVTTGLLVVVAWKRRPG